MRTLNDYFLTANILDLDTAGTIYIAVPDGGEIVSVRVALEAAIGTADEDITIKTAQGTVAPVLTIVENSSSAGDVFSITPTSNNYVAEGETIEIENDGATDTSGVGGMVTLVIRR